jgi:hypothetical protein
MKILISQDGKSIESFNDLRIMEDSRCKQYLIGSQINTLGYYSTKEKVNKVFNDVLKWLKNSLCYSDFKFPLDSEVKID